MSFQSSSLSSLLLDYFSSILSVALLWTTERNSLKDDLLVTGIVRKYETYLGRGTKNSGRWTHLVSWTPPAQGTWTLPDLPWRRTSPSSWPTVRSTWRPASQSWGTVPTCPSSLRCSRRTWEIREDESPCRSCDCWEEVGEDQFVVMRVLPEGSKRLVEWREEVHDRSSLLLRLGRKFPVTSLNSIFFHC